MSDHELQRRVDALLAAADPPGAGVVFSPFFGDGAARAGALAEGVAEGLASERDATAADRRPDAPGGTS